MLITRTHISLLAGLFSIVSTEVIAADAGSIDQALKKQIQTQEKALSNYQALVKAEETRFAQGESSLFLINSRETKAMEAAEKLTELKAYLFKTIYALQASAGVLI